MISKRLKKKMKNYQNINKIKINNFRKQKKDMKHLNS